MEIEEKIFNEIKQESIRIWGTYSNEFGYANEKIERINKLNKNEWGVLMMVQMFDVNNQKKLRENLSNEAIQCVDKIMRGDFPV